MKEKLDAVTCVVRVWTQYQCVRPVPSTSAYGGRCHVGSKVGMVFLWCVGQRGFSGLGTLQRVFHIRHIRSHMRATGLLPQRPSEFCLRKHSQRCGQNVLSTRTKFQTGSKVGKRPKIAPYRPNKISIQLSHDLKWSFYL